MKFLIIHNRYSRTGGEESVVAAQVRLLRDRGHEVLIYERSYDEIRSWRMGRLQSLFTALYSPSSVADIRALIRRERPDVAIVHNLFPVISAAILPLLKRNGVRVLMTLHNYRLVCPTGLFYRRCEVCERCGSGPLREWHCATGRCEGSWSGSVAYALRGWWSRRRGYFVHGVDRFLALSDFQRSKLVEYGLPQERIAVIPNFVDIPDTVSARDSAPYIAYVGRLSHEKGVDLLFGAARLLPGVHFRVAGAASCDISLGEVPPNVELVGFLDREQLARFYGGALAMVLSSRCWEGFPLSVTEAMSYARAVVVPRWAALPEIVDGGRCGALYVPCSTADMARAIGELWSNPRRADELGLMARERARSLYTADLYYAALMAEATAAVDRR